MKVRTARRSGSASSPPARTRPASSSPRSDGERDRLRGGQHAARAASFGLDAELTAVYLRGAFQRAGVGRRLVREVAQAQRAHGATGLIVWVIAGNKIGARHSTRASAASCWSSSRSSGTAWTWSRSATAGAASMRWSRPAARRPLTRYATDAPMRKRADGHSRSRSRSPTRLHQFRRRAMTIKVAINGYGRIGRNILRAHYEGGKKHDIAIVAINDLGSPETNAHLTRYDTAHGKFPGKVAVDGDSMVVDGDRIKVFAQRDPAAAAVGLARRRRRARVHRASSPPRTRRRRTSQGRCEKGDHLRARRQGRRCDDRLRRQPPDAEGDAHGDLERIVHDQLPRAAGEAAARRRSASSTD